MSFTPIHPSTYLYECPTCSAAVRNQRVHELWHDKLAADIGASQRGHHNPGETTPAPAVGCMCNLLKPGIACPEHGFNRKAYPPGVTPR